MIPKEFVKNHEEELRGRVHLKAPGSAAWPVDVVRTQGEVWLQNGWPEFAKFYSLSFGSLLVFEYLEHFNIRVRVFDTSATEIDYSLTCDPNLDDGESVPRVRKRDSSRRCELVRACKKTRASTEETFHNGFKLKQEKANGDRGSAKEEIERAVNLAASFKSEKPFFIIHMRPTYVSGVSVEVRKSFLETFRKWMNKGKGQVIFQIGRRSWLVGYTFSAGDRCTLTAGWKTFRTDNSLKTIPEKFVRKYGGELQGGVLLKAPGAPPWSVDVQREEGKVWLRNGWPQFAKFYSLCFGHFIFFEYQGNCNFKVVIFDTSTTEIDYPVQFEERSGSDQLQVFKKKQVHSGCDAACYLGESLKGRLLKEKIAEALSETSISDENEHGGIEKPSHANGTPHDIPMRQHIVKGKFTSRVSSPAEEKDRAHARAKALKSIHPSFKVVMQPSYVGKTYGLTIPRKFIAHGYDLADKIFLKAPESSVWVVDLERNTGETILRKGWPEFAAFYSISIGHVILFKYEGNSQFHVTILDNSCTEIEYPMSASHNAQANRSRGSRKRKELASSDNHVEIWEKSSNSHPAKDTSSEKYSMPGKKRKIVLACAETRHQVGRGEHRKQKQALITSKEGRKIKGTDTNEAGTAGIEKPDTAIPIQANGIQHKRIKPVKVEAGLDDPIPHKGASESAIEEGEARALALAQAFKSSKPSFIRRVYPSHVDGTQHGMHVTTAFKEAYENWKNNEQLTLQIAERTWQAECRWTSIGYKIGKGWCKFARDTSLAAGDVCVFELVNSSQKLFKVVIYRATVKNENW
ncbi:hypothetical protein ACET3Z_026855 [Daucus carota]